MSTYKKKILKHSVEDLPGVLAKDACGTCLTPLE
jgi:hypothetical protein